ncbi:MAG: RpiB/LacA/LacB family sugar-phosphate isomerase [Alphaproteobacteria bacterium]|nr:RpiB/LacA/LacB family sugar-phosphate isomerase [Alphaproteobacteria bacterium]
MAKRERLKIAIASDHGGYGLKEYLKLKLAKDYDIYDLGPSSSERTDFPKYAAAVAKFLSADKHSVGILACRNGIGMTIAANRFPHVRAAILFNDKAVMRARRDDDANVAVLAADYFSRAKNLKFVKRFLNSEFNTADPRYKKRVSMLGKLCKG